MKQGTRPDAAIGEAKRQAIAGGFRIIEVMCSKEPAFDFAVERNGVTSLVRVRRLKNPGFREANILRLCARQIRELRECPLFKGSDLEIWVRGPARAFHRFRVLPESLEALGDPGVPRAVVGTHEPQEAGPLPWYERPITRVVGEVKEVPYVRESPIKRERREAMFRGYAKYIAGLREKEKAAENVGSGTLDTVVSTKPGTTPMGAREPENGDPDTGAADPV